MVLTVSCLLPGWAAAVAAEARREVATVHTGWEVTTLTRQRMRTGSATLPLAHQRQDARLATDRELISRTEVVNAIRTGGTHWGLCGSPPRLYL